MNIEVEIRAKVSDFNKIKEALEKIKADFIKSENQMDRIYGASKFLDSERKIIEGGIVARIREVDGKSTLDFKEILREKGGIELSCKISNIEMAEKMLKKLDFEEAFTVKKRREIYSYQDFEICLDQVEKLGNFVEIEKMVDLKEKISNAREECINLLGQISPGVKITNEKYGDMMQNIINKNK